MEELGVSSSLGLLVDTRHGEFGFLREEGARKLKR
jgi:hypothetical protein